MEHQVVTRHGQNHPEEVECPWSPKARVGAMLLVVMEEVMEVLAVLKARERFLAALAVVVLAFPAALVAVVEMLVAAVMASLVALVAALAMVVPHPFVAPF